MSSSTITFTDWELVAAFTALTAARDRFQGAENDAALAGAIAKVTTAVMRDIPTPRLVEMGEYLERIGS